MKRTVGLLVAACLALGGLAPAAHADVEQTVCPRMGDQPSGTTFQVEGSGANAFLGGWKTEDLAARLCFRGLGGVYGPTTVTSTWTTRWNPFQSAGLGATFQLITANPCSEVSFSVAERARIRGEKWFPWMALRVKSSSPVGALEGESKAAVFAASSGSGHHLPDIQWEWRITATADSATAMDVSANLQVH